MIPATYAVMLRQGLDVTRTLAPEPPNPSVAQLDILSMRMDGQNSEGMYPIAKIRPPAELQVALLLLIDLGKSKIR